VEFCNFWGDSERPREAECGQVVYFSIMSIAERNEFPKTVSSASKKFF
jgi:hypothetical protein